MTLGDLGYTGATNANNYVHPAYTARSINTSGATVLDILTTDTLGHVTAASTRTLTLANLGYTGNADTLDNLNSTQFQRLDAGNTIALGNLNRFTSATEMSTTSGSQSSLECYSGTVGGDAFMTFHVGGDYATYLGVNGATNKLSTGGWSAGLAVNAIYHEGNKPTLAELGAQAAGTYNTVIGTDTDINTSGSTIIDNIFVTDGVITSMGTRALTLANLGYTGATNANNYVHPAYTARTVSVDTGPLTGATVISDLDFNISSNTIGSVTSAAGTVATRTLTLGDLGYTGATNANFITNNNQLTNGAGYYNSGDNVSLGTVNCSSVTATGDITAFSDARLKSNIETLPSDVIYNMRGVTYEKDGRQSSGVIAQELLAAGADELVHDNDVALSVNYNGLTGYLIETVKSLKSELDELKAEIEVLKRG